MWRGDNKSVSCCCTCLPRSSVTVLHLGRGVRRSRVTSHPVTVRGVLGPNFHLQVGYRDKRLVIFLRPSRKKNRDSNSNYVKTREEDCALLGCYAVSSGNSLPTFRDNRSVQSSGFKNPRRLKLHILEDRFLLYS